MARHEAISIAWREQRRRPGRSLAVMFGFLLAVSAFLGFSLLFHADRLAEDEILRRVGGYFAAFAPLPSTGVATPPAELPRVKDASEGFIANTILTCLFPRSLVTKLRAVDGVAEVVPVLLFRMRSRQDAHMFTLGGIDMSRPLAVERTCCAPSDVKSGVFLGLATGSEGPGAMLDDGYAAVRGLEVGETIDIGGVGFRVTGIIDTGVRPVHADVYLVWDDAAKVLAPLMAEPLGDRANVFIVAVTSVLEQNAAIAGVKNITGAVITSYNCFRPASKVVGLNEKAAGILGIVLYGVAVLFSLKSQLAALVERRREFGILRSIGWSDRDIGAQLVWEAFLPASIGAMGGVLVGFSVFVLFGMPVLKQAGLPWTTAIDACLIARGVVLALAGSALTGFLAALLVRRTSPAEALRTI
ncbi:MAG TPA: ABC transporter permease [Candidatus Ozemobacteraceae bacterium]|nr:ABC transporter permease [Candidatus Ozemobacteraceae bacterium]HQG28586.1 ABC transporter permease [Candidatus Ozemobacteraceae bacterium]